MTTLSTQPEVQHPYVTREPGVCGGKPIIAGTRIKVSLVAREHELMGMLPKEILQAHPHLTLAQIHDALSYYHDHSAEIIAEIREADALVEKLREEAGPSAVAARLRATGKLRR
ncbi:MAG TPA: DUF433 domain-containing protein [Armatimonadota bacterium]|nr:DUF433 domain-containing protein [Armatimonadota bacterium]